MTIAKEKTRLITADELLRLDSVGIRGELIRGVFYRIRASEFRHSIVGANVCYLLGIFIRPGRMGHLVAARTGVQLEWNPDTVREVDCAYISYAKWPRGERNSGYIQVPPDIVVEVVSSADHPTSVNDKAWMWLNYGVPLVWVVNPGAAWWRYTSPAPRSSYWTRMMHWMGTGLDRLHLPGAGCL